MDPTTKKIKNEFVKLVNNFFKKNKVSPENAMIMIIFITMDAVKKISKKNK